MIFYDITVVVKPTHAPWPTRKRGIQGYVGQDEMAPKSSLKVNATVEQTSEERLRKIRNMCVRHESILQRRNWHMILDDKLQVGFCPIQKVGSTFWRRVLEYTGGRRSYTSLFAVKWHDMKTPHVEKYGDRALSLLDSSIKFMFVRNPYQRLFSGWVDKLFSPNPMYWNKIGQHVKLFLNRNATSACGHDASFAEFVKYFIHTQRIQMKRDPHFIPMYEHCSPCHHTFDFIGTMETFSTDAAYLLKIISSRSNVNISIEDIKDAGYDSLFDHNMRLYRFKQNILKCVSFYEAMQRTWRNLQIRGYLGINMSVPFTREEADTVTKEEFMSALVTAYESSGSRSYRRSNRREALIEAYATVSTADLEKLRRIFKPDWALFGYNDRPIEIFELSRHYKSSHGFFEILK
ncbi:carbohydrate sulfotransferase 9-like [Ylistrum balloti]|uniref:carbohydrate sulfotransferase 9-like n=1 Tax=Ylistrum balloti TaxID=509963 RepID=UPI0029057DA4|nr:carbohydrate sulfotransferase 9-like [Ylistrum balloti]